MFQDQKLLDAFEPHTYEAWRKEVDDQLKGAPFEKRLVKSTYEGIDILPMYFAADAESLDHVRALPGQSPFVRGSRPLGHRVRPWLVAQEILAGDPSAFHEAARKDLDRGQAALNIVLDRAGRCGQDPGEAEDGLVGAGGVSIACLEDLEVLFRNIDLARVPLILQPGAAGLSLAGLLVACLERRGTPPDAVTVCLSVDPLGTLACRGELPRSLEDACREMAAVARWAAAHAPGWKTVAASGHPYHNGGGHAVQELAFSLATGVEYVRCLQGSGLSAAEAARSVFFSLSIGSDFFMEIAKLRAARLVWQEAVGAFGGGEEAQKLFLHARTSAFNKTRVDPYVNMLRVTTEAFAGICGGCDSMHVSPFDEPFDRSDEFSRRIARNLQNLLKDEAHFDKVVDPAGGSWYVEVLTDQVARKAWRLFQEIEGMGGMRKALEHGFVQAQVAETAAKRARNTATRQDVYVGVNQYANPQEKPLDRPAPDLAEWVRRRRAAVASLRKGGDLSARSARLEALAACDDDAARLDAVRSAAGAGATLGEINAALDRSRPRDARARVDPIASHRGAEPFEALRRRTEAFAARTGQSPRVFLANLGPIPQHKARADFSIGFFSVAGFEVINNNGFDSVDAAAEAALASGARVATLCSTDAAYPEWVPALTRKIKAADPGMFVVLAGYPKDQVAAFQAAGVDAFIHLRADALAMLQGLQERLGVAP